MSLDGRANGFFLISLDTEIGWGHFDQDATRRKLISSDGSRERRSIDRILGLLEEYGIAATWAVVGHLFFRECEGCDLCPILEWKDRYQCFQQIYETSHPLWYGSDIIDQLLERGSTNELAFHGYTHRPFSELTAAQAIEEIQEWSRLGARRGLSPKTVIFPRGRIGHLDILRQFGFTSYRAKPVPPGEGTPPLISKLINRIDMIYPLREVRLLPATADSSGLVRIPVSSKLFPFRPGTAKVLKRLGLEHMGLGRIERGIERAAAERGIVHLYCHPYEFTSEAHFDHLERVLRAASGHIGEGHLVSTTLADFADRFLSQAVVQSG